MARAGKNASRDAAIVAAYHGGATMRECAEPYGLTSARVSQILKANGCSPTKEEWRARQAAATKANWQDPEFRARNAAATKASIERKLSWCPESLLADYRLLVRHLGAREARATIERQAKGDKVIAICPSCERHLGHPDCRSCTQIGCPLSCEERAA